MFASNVTHTNRRGVYFLTTLTLLLMPLLSASNASVRAAPAYTEVGGPIISDTTWTLANSPYIVVANVEVWQGVTLTIQPEVVVKFNKDKLLQVNGTLIARGTADRSITFTSNQASPQKGDWKNIAFNDSSTDASFDGAGNYTGGSVLEYCVVEYGGSGVDGAVQADQASPLVDHCTVRSNSTSGIWAKVDSPTIVIRNNIVSGNTAVYGGGICAYGSTLTGNTVSGNTGGGILVQSNSKVTGNIVSGNTGGGIGAHFSTVTGNTVSGNTGGGIYASVSKVVGNTVIGNLNSYAGGGIYATDSTVVADNIVSGNITSGNSGGGIYAARGSQVTGNIVSGNSAVYYCGGICANSSDVISNTIIANTVLVNGQGVGLYQSKEWNMPYSAGDIIGNTIVGNTAVSPSTITSGLAIEDVSRFHYNNIYGNSNYDVIILRGVVNGTNNYWGTVATVDILRHVYDWYDDTSLGKLLFVPYLQDPDPASPVPPPLNLRAAFSGGSVSLTWDPIPSTTMGFGYKVYYDNDASGPPYNGTGAAQGNSPVDVGNATQFTLSGLGSGHVYIAVTAYDTQGRESWYSNEASRPWRAYLPAVLK